MSIVPHDPGASQVPALEFTDSQIDLIKKTLAPGLSSQEFDLYMEVCHAAALNPFLKQIYAWKVKGKLIVHIGIDGHRAIAQRSGFFGGKGRPLFGRPVQAKLSPGLTVPEDCEMTVRRLVPGGGSIPTVGYCRFEEFARTTLDNGKFRLTEMWESMPYNQLAKCTEAQALRAGFQHDFGRIFEAIQKLGVALDLRGDMGGDDAREVTSAELTEGECQMALEAGQTGQRIIVPVSTRTRETVGAMQREAAAAQTQRNPDAAREQAVREQMRRQETPEARREGARQAERTRALGHLFGLWKEVFGDPIPRDKEERAAFRAERIRKMAELMEFPPERVATFDSWDKLSDAEIGEATARLEVLRNEKREAAAAQGPDDDDTDDPTRPAPAAAAGREPGDESQGSMFTRGRR